MDGDSYTSIPPVGEAENKQMGWDGIAWDGMGWDGMRWDQIGVKCTVLYRSVWDGIHCIAPRGIELGCIT